MHELIVAAMRREGAAKIDKDVAQAAALIEMLAERRAHDLGEAWREASRRGPKWRKALAHGAAMLPEEAGALLREAIGEKATERQTRAGAARPARKGRGIAKGKRA